MVVMMMIFTVCFDVDAHLERRSIGPLWSTGASEERFLVRNPDIPQQSREAAQERLKGLERDQDAFSELYLLAAEEVVDSLREAFTPLRVDLVVKPGPFRLTEALRAELFEDLLTARIHCYRANGAWVIEAEGLKWEL